MGPSLLKNGNNLKPLMPGSGIISYYCPRKYTMVAMRRGGLTGGRGKYGPKWMKLGLADGGGGGSGSWKGSRMDTAQRHPGCESCKGGRNS